MMRSKPDAVGRPDAEEIAAALLGCLAGDPDRLGRFLDDTGLRPDTIRSVAGQPGFLAAILDHVAGDEALLIACAGEIGVTPERIVRAQQVLSPGEAWD